MKKKIVTIRLLVDHDLERQSPAHLVHAVEKAKVAAERAFESYDFDVPGGEAFYGNATKEDCVRFTPRKVHFVPGMALYTSSMPICSETKMISHRYLTQDWQKVTCKNCLKKQPQPVQKEMFSGG